MKDQHSPTVVLNRVELHTDTSLANEHSPKNGPADYDKYATSNLHTIILTDSAKKKYLTNSGHTTPISNKFSKSDGAVTSSGNLNVTDNG